MPNDDDKLNPNYVPPGYDSKKDAIDLVAYNPSWVQSAQLEIKMLSLHLPKEQIVDIQHVGSTAIPGIMAKPIIDIQIAVRSLPAIRDIAIHHLESLGYHFWYGNPDKERLFFVKGMPPFGEKRTHHVHIVESTSKHWIDKLMFRDYLRGHPEAKAQYEALKLSLSEQYRFDREKYTDLKKDFINHILTLASESNKN